MNKGDTDKDDTKDKAPDKGDTNKDDTNEVDVKKDDDVQGRGRLLVCPACDLVVKVRESAGGDQEKRGGTS